MKKCSTCQSLKPLADFYKKGKTGGTNSLCKKCFNKFCQDRWIQRKKDMIELLGGKCSCCGYSKFYGALEFHHKNPGEKEFDWKRTRTLSEDKMVAEVKKCDLLCANCHREVHQAFPTGFEPVTN